jgi:hypothetical protein
MQLTLRVIKFDATSKKISIGIEIEELNEKDIPALIQMVREETILFGNLRKVQDEPEV